MSRSSKPNPVTNQGVALVFVLVMIVFMGTVTVAFLDDAVARIKYQGLFQRSDTLRVDAYSALEVALGVMNQVGEVADGIYGKQQGWGDPYAYAGLAPAQGTRIQIEFEDESGKFPLRTIDQQTLEYLLDEILVNVTLAEDLAKTFADWTDKDDLRNFGSIDGDDYLDQSPPILPPNRPVESWEEFRLIDGWGEVFFDGNGRPNRSFERFRSAVSLYHDGEVNLNSANTLVLATLERANKADPSAIIDYRAGTDGEVGTPDDNLLISEENYLLEGSSGGFQASVMQVRVTASRGEAVFLLSAVVKWKFGAQPGAANNPSQEEGRSEVGSDQRGTTRQRSGLANKLGYPFEIIRLSENVKL